MYSYDDKPLSIFPTANCYPAQDITKMDEYSVLQHLISGKNILIYIKFYPLMFKSLNYIICRDTVIKHK